MWPFRRKSNDQDWVKFIGGLPPETRKQRLISECQRHDVAVHIDDHSESTSGVNAILRAVASEAELEQRLNAKLAIRQAHRSNAIAGISLLVSLVALGVSIWK